MRTRRMSAHHGRHHDDFVRRDRDRQRPGRTVPGGAAGQCRHEDGADRARASRRHLRQRRLHPDQDARRQRAHGARRAPRRRVRRAHRRTGERRHAGGEGAQGRNRRAVDRRPREVDREHREPHARLGPCAVRRTACRRGRWNDARGRQDLHQRRRPGGAADLGRDRERAGADQQLDDGHRHVARAPDRRRRQLHRPRVRADVPALRFARHGARVRRPADRARGPRGLGRGADNPRERRRRLPLLGEERDRDDGRRRPGRAPADRRPRCARDRGQPPARSRRPPAEHRRPRPRPRGHRLRRARLHHGRRGAAHQRARRVGARRRPTVAARSRTPRSTTTRSSPTTSCTVRAGG